MISVVYSVIKDIRTVHDIYQTQPVFYYKQNINGNVHQHFLFCQTKLKKLLPPLPLPPPRFQKPNYPSRILEIKKKRKEKKNK